MGVSFRDVILEKQKQRYAYLLALYELSNGNKWEFISNKTICEKIKVDAAQTGWLIIQYLEGEGLAKLESMGWPNSDVSITHYGVLEVEASINRPEEPTDHFETQAITMVQNFYGAVGSIQNGDNTHATIQQNIGVSADQLAKIFSQIRQEIGQIPEPQRSGIEYMVDSLETEVTSPAPDPTKVKQLASGIWGFASSVLGQVTATFIQEQLGM